MIMMMSNAEEKESKLICSSIHFIKLKYQTATLLRRTSKIYSLLELFLSHSLIVI